MYQHTNHMRAVILVIVLAVLAFQASPDLSTNTNAISNLDFFYVLTNFDGTSDDLVAYTDGHGCITPASVDRVHIAATDTTAFGFDVDVVVGERFGFELRMGVSD